jgi:hypothetical protein
MMPFTKEDWKKARAALDVIEAERKKLLEPTEDRHTAAFDRLLEIEDDLGSECIGKCESCTDPIFEGEAYHSSEDCYLCEDCAPTYAEMLDRPGDFVSFKTGDHMTPEEAKEACDAHVANGGSLSDKMVSG